MTLPAPWRLTYDARDPWPGGDLPFGSYESRVLMVDDMPQQASADSANDDKARPRNDGTLFGEDFLGASNITFTLVASRENEPDVLETLDEFMAVWRADAVRRTPGAIATLTAHTGRSTFGRPRKPQSSDLRTFQGRAELTAEFLAADDLWYGPQQSMRVGLGQVATGGFVAPFIFPLIVGSGVTDRSQVFEVGGRLPTWVSTRIDGPIVNPSVEVPGRFRYGFPTTLRDGEWIDVKATPFGHVMLRNGTSGIAADAQSSLVNRSLLPPGKHELILRGQSPSGSPSALATWRNAYPHW
jgi:hypothetical protein